MLLVQHLAENGFAQNAFGNARISDLRAAAAQQKLITMQWMVSLFTRIVSVFILFTYFDKKGVSSLSQPKLPSSTWIACELTITQRQWKRLYLVKIYFKPCVEKHREREVTPKDKLLEKQAIETKQHKAKQSKKKKQLQKTNQNTQQNYWEKF